MYYMHTHCSYTEDYADGVHTYTFSGPCVKMGKTYSAKVVDSELYALNQGGGIMALVSTNADDREFLMSGHSPEGWDLLFGQEGGDA